jgi:hypothetical protein
MEAQLLGETEGAAAGVARAMSDAHRLGVMHGAALGDEMGFLEGLGLLFCGARADGSAAARSSRAATQLVELVSSLGLSSGEPLAADIDVVAVVQRARALAKLVASAQSLPPDILANASARSSSGSSAGASADAAGSRAAASSASARTAALTIDF